MLREYVYCRRCRRSHKVEEGSYDLVRGRWWYVDCPRSDRPLTPELNERTGKWSLPKAPERFPVQVKQQFAPEVVKALRRLQRLLARERMVNAQVFEEQYSDEVLRRLRPVITTRAIEKARDHLDELLLSEVPVVPVKKRSKA